MVKVVVEIELDNESYDRAYGPGSEHWNKYMVTTVYDDEHPEGVRTTKPASEYEPMEDTLLINSITEVLGVGFHDWDSKGWMKLKIDGKPVRECCGGLEGWGHADWCPAIVGPEASETA